MKDLPTSPEPREFMRVEGSDAVRRLLVEAMGKRLKSLDAEVDHRFVAEALCRVSAGFMDPEKLAGMVLSRGSQGDLVATLGDSWKVSLSYEGRYEGGQLSATWNPVRSASPPLLTFIVARNAWRSSVTVCSISILTRMQTESCAAAGIAEPSNAEIQRQWTSRKVEQRKNLTEKLKEIC